MYFLILKVYCDNGSLCFIVKTIKDPAARNILRPLLMVRDKIKEGEMLIEHINTEVIIADSLTKDLAPKLFNKHAIGMAVLNFLIFWVCGAMCIMDVILTCLIWVVINTCIFLAHCICLYGAHEVYMRVIPYDCFEVFMVLDKHVDYINC